MSKKTTPYLIIDTSSSNEYHGDCDFGLIPLTPAYVKELLQYRNMVTFLHWADDRIYNLEYWDATCRYFRNNDQLVGLKDIQGQPISNMPRGEPIILGSVPEIAEDDFQQVECQTVQVGTQDIWWVGYVKHTNIRIETAHINYRVLERLPRRFTPRQDRSPSD